MLEKDSFQTNWESCSKSEHKSKKYHQHNSLFTNRATSFNIGVLQSAEARLPANSCFNKGSREGREDMSAISEPKIEELVNREPQIEQFNNLLKEIERQLAKTNLLEYVAGPGIGKTQLIRLFQRECNSRTVPWAVINFKEADVQGRLSHYVKDPTKLIEDIVLDLARKTSVESARLHEAINAYRNSNTDREAVRDYFKLSPVDLLYEQPEWVGQLRHVLRAFLDVLRQVRWPYRADATRPVIFFFDETEYAPTQLVDWLEEWILNPVVSLKNCLVIWTARSQQEWKTPYIRQQTQSQPLPPFDLEETTEQLQHRAEAFSNLAAEFFSQVYEVTQGHPAANAFAINQIEQWPEKSLEKVKADLLKDIFQNFVLDYVFSSLKKQDERTACELAALVRWFDTVMLRNLLQEMRKTQFQGESQEYFGNLMQRLKRTPLLTWEKGYALESALRPLIRNYYLTCRRDEYIKVHKTARNVYRNWLDKQMDNPNLYIVEELYHTACLQQADAIDTSPEILLTILRERLQAYMLQQNLDDEWRQHVLERLKGELERDQELNKLVKGHSWSQYVDEFLHQADTASELKETVSVVVSEAT